MERAEECLEHVQCVECVEHVEHNEPPEWNCHSLIFYNSFAAEFSILYVPSLIF